MKPPLPRTSFVVTLIKSMHAHTQMTAALPYTPPGVPLLPRRDFLRLAVQTRPDLSHSLPYTATPHRCGLHPQSCTPLPPRTLHSLLSALALVVSRVLVGLDVRRRVELVVVLLNGRAGLGGAGISRMACQDTAKTGTNVSGTIAGGRYEETGGLYLAHRPSGQSVGVLSMWWRVAPG